MEAFPQVVQEGALAGVSVQQDEVLDAHAVPRRQGTLHVPQDPVTALLQALKQAHPRSVSTTTTTTTKQDKETTFLTTEDCSITSYILVTQLMAVVVKNFSRCPRKARSFMSYIWS